jgi:hypothetical protein
MARSRKDFGLSRFWLVNALLFICYQRYQPHSWLLVLDGEPDLFSLYLDRIMYNAGILNVMARTRPDLGSSRYGLVDEPWFIPFSKMISASPSMVGLGWKTAHAFPAFD